MRVRAASVHADVWHVVTREDPTRSGERYDLVLDLASTLSLDDCRRVLTAHGIYVSIGHTSYGTPTFAK